MIFGFIDNAEIEFLTANAGGLRTDGPTGERLAQVGFDPGILRPVVDGDGKKYCLVANGRTKKGPNGKDVADRDWIPLGRLIANGMVPAVYNASALPYQAWQMIDRAVIKASRDRLNAWNDLAAVSTYSGFNGMAITGIVKDTITDMGDAKVDMDTLSDDLNDAPLVTPDILPLPIIHAGFNLSQRRLAVSRNSGMPLDTTGAEQCARRCAETLEKITIGMTDLSSTVIGSSTEFTRRGIYGFQTQPDRITKTDVTASSSFDAETFVQEVIAMKELARAQKFYGPFVLYYSTTWDQYLARDYYVMTTSGAAAPTKTVLQRVEEIKGISRVQMLDFFTDTDELLLVQMNSDTVRAVDGMDWTTVQWEEQGGARINFRVMGIKVPDLRAQYVGTSTSTRKCGIVHGTTS